MRLHGNLRAPARRAATGTKSSSISNLGKALEVAAEMEAAGFSPDATTGIEH